MKVGLCSILLLASVAAVSAGCSSYASCGTCAVAAGCEWCPYEGVCTNAFSGIACSASVTNSSLCNDPCLSSSGSCERCLFASPTSGGSCGYCASSSLCFQQGSSGSAPAIAGACPSGGFATNSGECFFINSVLYLVLVIVGPILVVAIIVTVVVCCCCAVTCCAAAGGAATGAVRGAQKQQSYTIMSENTSMTTGYGQTGGYTVSATAQY
mmetsp:Transcript_16280/g.41258  ORF Transcript_16280/g.41258 Transcript_16280/m.41258 type:complete len:211 (-) Transcript_16280:793-1425(-)